MHEGPIFLWHSQHCFQRSMTLPYLHASVLTVRNKMCTPRAAATIDTIPTVSMPIRWLAVLLICKTHSKQAEAKQPTVSQQPPDTSSEVHLSATTQEPQPVGGTPAAQKTVTCTAWPTWAHAVWKMNRVSVLHACSAAPTQHFPLSFAACAPHRSAHLHPRH